jgi:CheY-like chemotaxis protein
MEDSHEKKALLIADDAACVRSSLVDMLKDLIERMDVDVDVLEAGDGHAALMIVDDQHDRLIAVLTDMQMPGANGFEVYEEANKHGIPTAIISTAPKISLPDGDYTYLDKLGEISTVKEWMTRCLGALETDPEAEV